MMLEVTDLHAHGQLDTARRVRLGALVGRLGKPGTTNPEAHRKYLKGRYFSN